MLAELINWATQKAYHPWLTDLVLVSLATLKYRYVSEIQKSRRSSLHITSAPENPMNSSEPVGQFLRAAQAKTQHTLFVSHGHASSGTLSAHSQLPESTGDSSIGKKKVTRPSMLAFNPVL